MSKAVLISIQPKWCELIASGKKTIEVRKTKPKIPTPFKCYIYQTKRTWIYNVYSQIADWQRKVIGEFVCDAIITDRTFGHDPLFNVMSCMSDTEIAAYCTKNEMYGWHISKLKIYDKPKELSEFYKKDFEEAYSTWEDLFSIGVPTGCVVQYPPEPKEEDYIIKRPPQSWCYVEEIVSTACCENFDECAGCCHNTNCGYFDDLLRLGDKKAFEENCVGCCCGDGTLCNKNNGGCSNYEIKPIMG